jgi:hypothetical protein
VVCCATAIAAHIVVVQFQLDSQVKFSEFVVNTHHLIFNSQALISIAESFHTNSHQYILNIQSCGLYTANQFRALKEPQYIAIFVQ